MSYYPLPSHKYGNKSHEQYPSNYDMDFFTRNHSHKKQSPESGEHSDQPFSFDDSVCRAKKKLTIQFSKFDKEARGDILAKSLIEENSHLKERLRQSEDVIRNLQSELTLYRSQSSSIEVQLESERAKLQSKVVEFREEIVAILVSNKKLHTEIASLHNALQQKGMSRRVVNTRSQDRFCFKENRPSLKVGLAQNTSQMRKVEELMDSIRGMHLKIMGFRADSLKDIWRWLKSIALVYSSIRKWRERFSDLSAHSRPERLREGLFEVFDILD